MKQCPKCQHQSPDKVNFCLSCGADISNIPTEAELFSEQQTGYKECPNCSAINPDKNQVCQNCGADISNILIVPVEREDIKPAGGLLFSEKSIGETLKKVAVIFAIISIILCIIGAIVSISTYIHEISTYGRRLADDVILAKNMTSFILCIVGAVLCPLASLPLYGFGTLITTVQSIDRKLK